MAPLFDIDGQFGPLILTNFPFIGRLGDEYFISREDSSEAEN